MSRRGVRLAERHVEGVSGSARRLHASAIALVVIVSMGITHPRCVDADPPGSRWSLVLDDEFNASPGSLPDPALWATCPRAGCVPPPRRLSHYALREGLLDHFDGNALELYVADCSRSTSAGVCVEGVPYASGAIRSTQAFQYGYVEIRWNLTLLSGEHPTFWMLPGQGPPEFDIDIAEFAGDDPFTVHMGLYWDNEQKHEPRALKDGTNWGDSNYHTFGADWEPDGITWYVDGVKQPKPITRHVPDVPMYPLVTVQVGGTGFAGRPDAQLDPIASVAIDHIRVWRHCSGCGCALVPVQ